MTDVAQVSNSLPATPSQAAAAQDPAHLWKDKSFSFHDLLDIINPLQHIPIISTIYRYLTGDTIGNVARVAGDALYGGPIGMATGIIAAGVQIETGKDIGDHVLAMLSGDDSPGSPAPVALAANSPAQPPAITAAATSTPAAGLALLRPAAQADDPRQAFLARAQAMHLQSGAGDSASQPGRALSSRVVPLEGPASALAGRRVIGSPFTAAPAGAPPRTIAQPADPAATMPAIRASLATPDGPGPALPGNPPIDISQQMLEALDKYARLQQQKSQGQSRGAMVDTVQ
jgi:hypothetical protein